MNNISSQINRIYADWGKGRDLVTVIKHVLLGTKFTSLMDSLADGTVDMYQNLGFITWEPSSKRLHCPVIWMRAAAPYLQVGYRCKFWL